MKQRFGVFAMFVLVGTFASPGKVLGQSEVDLANGLTLTVEVYNWANVSPVTLEKGQEVAGKILAEAGVKLRWVDCPCEKPRPDATTLSSALFRSFLVQFLARRFAAIISVLLP